VAQSIQIRMVNWKGYRRKRAWPNLRYYIGICLEELRKIPKNFSRFPVRVLNLGPPKHKSEVLITGPRRQTLASHLKLIDTIAHFHHVQTSPGAQSAFYTMSTRGKIIYVTFYNLILCVIVDVNFYAFLLPV
jgi:hypothetical protein